jgi:hypothetical protein
MGKDRMASTEWRRPTSENRTISAVWTWRQKWYPCTAFEKERGAVGSTVI